MATSKNAAKNPVIADNKKAAFNYFFEERFEAGMVLEGWEVKALRAGKAQEALDNGLKGKDLAGNDKDKLTLALAVTTACSIAAAKSRRHSLAFESAATRSRAGTPSASASPRLAVSRTPARTSGYTSFDTPGISRNGRTS